MRGWFVALAVGAVLTGLVLSSFASVGSPSARSTPLGSSATPAAPSPGPASTGPGSGGSVVSPTATPSSASQAFDRRVTSTAEALAAAGVNPHEIRLPYTGRPAEVVDGAVVPGYALSAPLGPQATSGYPVPSGLAYYGENNTTGTTETTVLNASTVAGTLTVNRMSALYLDVDTPDMWGIQLNAVLGNVTLLGVGGYEFWVQNAVDVFQHNQTINLGDDTWNFSSPSAYLAPGNATILNHSANGTIVGGLYVGEGPWLYAPQPFTLALYVNSSVTASGEQELWYNYSLSAAGGIHEAGNYDWVVFNSRAPLGPSAPLAPFVANGTGVDPAGIPNDFELDFGIGAYNGATMDVLSANVSATLDYCPATIGACTSSELRAVPAAEDFGGETGETGSGMFLTYNGTTATGTAGPMILRGLWGFQGATGSVAGSEPVRNAITVSGSPDPSATAPYVFVFLSTPSSFDPYYEWAPDVPVWHLAPGTYSYDIVLADYAEQTGSFVVGASATALTVALPYHPASGVYTPLWALNDGQLAGISTFGDGTMADQYLPFNNPTYHCTECGGAANGNLSPLFAMANDYLYPTFAGVLFDGTTAYVDLSQEVSFCVEYETWGLISPLQPHVSFDLQIQFVSTEHVTLADDAYIGGWPAFFETETLAGFVDGAVNPFPQASVTIWNSSEDLVMSNTFVSTNPIPDPLGACVGTCPAIVCYTYACASPDGLLLYGGDQNTVWGNTFHDPAQSTQPLAALAEAESGDLIYNNNFSMDNPTVYLPFDIYTDACPDGYAGDCGPLVPPMYADQWNVTPQPADQVSDVANGFALEGNVLGATCGSQGGNYWNDYGNALNPTSTLPFINAYNYSAIVSILPPESSDVQASIRVGGDYAPLSRSACGPGETLRFHEIGLPSGSEWAVELSGGFQTSSAGTTIATTVPSGIASFTLLPPSDYGLVLVTGPGSPTYDSVNVSGPTELTVRFGALETVTFAQHLFVVSPVGPGANVTWGVALAPVRTGGPASKSASTDGSSVEFSLPAGAVYRFSVSTPSTFRAVPGSGKFTVPARALTKTIDLRQIVATIAFSEHGLPAGTNWSVTVTPTAPSGPAIVLWGTQKTLKVELTSGSYSFAVGAFAAYTTTPASGNLTVNAPHGYTVRVAFAHAIAPGALPSLGIDTSRGIGRAVARPAAPNGAPL